jgi:hypothetical protein
MKIKCEYGRVDDDKHEGFILAFVPVDRITHDCNHVVAVILTSLNYLITMPLDEIEVKDD